MVGGEGFIPVVGLRVGTGGGKWVGLGLRVGIGGGKRVGGGLWCVVGGQWRWRWKGGSGLLVEGGGWAVRMGGGLRVWQSEERERNEDGWIGFG